MPRWSVALAVSLALVATACSDDDPAVERADRSTTTATAAPSDSSTSSAPSATGTTLAPPAGGLVMTGPTGSGRASVTLIPERSEVCYQLTVRGIGAPSAAHVHRRDGEVVLGLQTPPADGTVETCAATDALLIEELAQRPADFYIDVHGALGDLRATLE